MTQLVTLLDNHQFLDILVSRVAALGMTYSKEVVPSSYLS